MPYLKWAEILSEDRILSSIIFYSGVIVLSLAYAGGFYYALKGNKFAQIFLWIWAVLLVVGFFCINRASAIPDYIAAIAAIFFVYEIFKLIYAKREKVSNTLSDTRRLLAVSNRKVEEERKAISRALHDEVNPNLLLSRNAIRQVIRNIDNTSKEEIVQIIDSIAEMLNSTYEKTRAIIRNTRVEIIDSVGFTAAVESMVNHYSTLFQSPRIKLNHNLLPRPDIEAEPAIEAYKIIREAVHNSVKHSKAETLSISITYNKPLDEYIVEIKDDGVGIKTSLKDGNDGIGLLDMKERAIVLGSEIKFSQTYPKDEKRPGTFVQFTFSGHPSEDTD